ncbi:MAG: phosphate ABC transporter permease PstA [Pseudomonadota bacterium]
MADASINMADLSAKHTSPETGRRTKARHRAEKRLKAYGILAIALAAGALITLMYTIAVKAISVTNEHYISLEVPLEASKRQMKLLTDGNPKTVANFERGPLRDAIMDAARYEGSKRKAKPLTELLATYEGYTLGEIVEQNQDLFGSSYHFEALMSDHVQLYYKGQFGRPIEAGTDGSMTITPGETEGEVVVDHQTNAFMAARAALRDDRALEGRNARRSANDQARAAEETQAKLAATTDAAERERLTAALAQFETRRDELIAIADGALTEATDTGNVFTLREDDPSVFIRAEKGWIKVTELGPETSRGVVVDPLAATGEVTAGQWKALMMVTPEAERQLNDRQVLWLENFEREDRLVTHFNWRALLGTDSAEAEYAGIWGALVGSFWTMMVTFMLVFPLGVMASIYLEEFAPKNRLTNFIEVNINNLAAVPSIVFGLLGLTILLSGVSLFGIDLFDGLLKAFLDDPRSTPLAGGVVLALMSLPTIIIAARASIKAVPPSIRDAALGLGASRLQTSMHHVLPLAMPGILTGSIIAMAQALGETAPLIIIGMNSFIQDVPGDPLEKANVLPSLIYLWNNNSERLFDGKTAVAIAVLLLFLILMNALAVVLRKRFERRW